MLGLPLDPDVYSLAIEIIQSQIAPFTEHKVETSAWLRESKADEEAKRLLICLAIDLCVFPPLAQPLARLLGPIEEAVSSGQAPRVAFARAIDGALKAGQINRAMLGRPVVSDASERYVRVTSLKAFTVYFAGDPGRGIPYTADAADQAEVRELYFSSKPIRKLDSVVRPWAGRNESCVWVCPSSEFEQVLGDGAAASRLNDALGLGYKSDSNEIPELVAVRYPPGFPSECFQPRTMHADWESANYFLPYTESDGWGRTHSCSGLTEGMRERIHLAFCHGLTEEYEAVYVGRISEIKHNRQQLYEETRQLFLRISMGDKSRAD